MITGGPSKFKDKYSKIQMASGYYPTSTVALSMTGVDDTLVEKPSEKASFYRCVLCMHTASQKAELFTHVCRVHLGVCILCQLCDYRTYRGVDFSAHLCKHHPQQEDDWLEPLPDLDNLVLSSARDLAVKRIKEEPIEEPIAIDSD